MPLFRSRSAGTRSLLSLAATLVASCDGSEPPGLVENEFPNVAFAPTSLSVAPGDTARVELRMSGRGAPPRVAFTSMSGVVAVDSTGLVTALMPGQGVVTATLTFTGSPPLSFSVPVTVRGIVLDPPTATLAKGATVTLRVASVAGGPPVTDPSTLRWGSSDTTVATVSSSGLVRALRGGTARITAAAAADPTYRGHTSIVVVCAGPLISALTVAPSAIALNPGGVAQIVARVEPNTCQPAPLPPFSRDADYASSDTTVATVTPTGLVTARGVGAATITVRSVAAPSVQQQVQVTVVAAPAAAERER